MMTTQQQPANMWMVEEGVANVTCFESTCGGVDVRAALWSFGEAAVDQTSAEQGGGGGTQ